MAGHARPIPAHERAMAHGALPATPDIADVEQEKTTIAPIPVRHDGPIFTHELPALHAATETIVVGLAPVTGRVRGKDRRRNRVLIISVDNPFYYATTKNGLANASVTAAAAWPPNVALELHNADEIYLACAPLGTFSSATTSTLGIVTENYAD